MARRVTVIGAGLAGLSAAATVAKAGAEVTVHEARTEIGGRARTHHEHGFLLNEGAHALFAGLDGIRILREFGIRPAGNKPPVAGGWGRLRGELGILPGTPKDALKSRIIGLRAKAELGRRLGRPASLLKYPNVGMSAAAWVDEYFSHPDARLVARMAVRTAMYTNDLETIAAEVAVPQTVSALVDSVIYLDGGWEQLVGALCNVLEANNGRIVTGSKVSSRSDIADDSIVIFAAGGATHAAEFMGPSSEIVHQWAREEVPVVAATLDLGLRRLPFPKRRFVLGVDEPLYISSHTPSAALALNGGEVVHVLRYGAGDNARAEMESLLDDAQPGWREEVVVERFGRQRVVAYGRPRATSGLRGRPGPRIPDCDGVLVAGDWVGPVGCLADAAIASGHAAALMALG